MTDSTPAPAAMEPRRIGPGCLVWTARVPAVACLVVLVGSAADFVWHGPMAHAEAAVVALASAAGTVGFVYYGALIETELSPTRALRAMPRVFLQDVVLFAILGAFALVSQAGGRDFGGGDGGHGGRSTGLRSNYASSLVDPVEFAAILGTAQVLATADGFDNPMGSLARIIGMDARAKAYFRLWLHVYQQRAAEHRWARAIASEQPAAGPGDAALSSRDRFTFKRGDTVVELRLTKSPVGLQAPDLAALAAAVDRRMHR